MASCVLWRRDWNLTAKCHLYQKCAFVVSQKHAWIWFLEKTLNSHNTC